MLWSELRFILKTSSVTPDFFYVFYLILSFSVKVLKKSVCGKFLGANVLNKAKVLPVKTTRARARVGEISCQQKFFSQLFTSALAVNNG